MTLNVSSYTEFSLCKISGTLIPNSCVEDLVEALQEDSEKMEEEKF